MPNRFSRNTPIRAANFITGLAGNEAVFTPLKAALIINGLKKSGVRVSPMRCDLTNLCSNRISAKLKQINFLTSRVCFRKTISSNSPHTRRIFLGDTFEIFQKQRFLNQTNSPLPDMPPVHSANRSAKNASLSFNWEKRFNHIIGEE